ncbi:MAG: PKD domain-containing protein, partial [Thermoproteota archaeon]|nr:PKD domain-containing protein [Thermoproteota archaeon]
DDDGSSVESDDDGTISHTFEQAGTYNVHLTVTDSSGQRASDSIRITVEEERAAAADQVNVDNDEEEQRAAAADEVDADEEEQQQQAAVEEQEEENNSGSNDGFDVGEFVDGLFDRLGLR